MPSIEGPERKDRFSALDTLAVARELRPLIRRRLDRAFDARPRGVALRFRATEGPDELTIVPGRYAVLLASTSDHPEAPGPFARELRRLLSGSMLTRVDEPRGERVLSLQFERSDGSPPLQLIAELFGTGNVVVVQGDRIAAVATPRRFAGREVRVGVDYRPPPSRPDPFSLPVEAIAGALASSTKDLVSTVAARLGFGGPVAEELIARAGLVSVAPAAERAPTAAVALRHTAEQLLVELGTAPRGFLVRRGATLLDATPYPSRRWTEGPGVELVEKPRYSEAAAEYFRPLVDELSEAVSADSARTEELRRQLEQQQTAIARLEADVAERQSQAGAVYAHYAEAEAALAAAESSTEPVVEATLGDVTVPLRRGSSPRASAQWLYDDAKRLQAKLAGARTALAHTEASMATETVAAPGARRGSAPSRTEARKRFWFQQFRWFIASDGEIVVAGRDASSNDQVVRRYLKEADWYVHADLHGAASVVVKHREPATSTVPEGTLREAAQFAVCYSKAWRAGHAVGRAFWVEADKVSKSAGSGEFVARGAWAIHGTKHFVEDVPLELAVGRISYEGTELWSVAPNSAVRSRGELRFLLAPGEERERGEREAELARELGVSRDLLQSLLPAGGISVRRA